MTYNPSANWTAAVDASQQAPVYYIAIDGKTDEDYSTHPVKSPATPKTVLMEPPKGGALSVDIIDGTRTVQQISVELLDVDGEITDLIATEASGAPLSTLINRKVTLYGGDKSLVESDYAPIFVGRIARLKMNRKLTGYVLTLSDMSHLLDGEIMTAATSVKPSTIRGNIVNLYWSILTGTFDTGHATFPLDFVSTDTGSSSVPTGLGIATALINETQLVAQRDTWHPGDVGEIVFNDPENGKSHLEDEFFRIFQAFPAIGGAGTIGLRFHVPALPASAAPLLDTDHVIDVQSWARLYGDHLNKFTISGDYDPTDDEYDTVLYNTETSEDTTDQSATGETIEYLAESKWLKTAYDGVGVAQELAGRMRIRYLKTPAVMDVLVNFRKRNLEQGDVAALSYPHVPDLLTGLRGATARLMTIISIRPDFDRGLLRMRLLDTGLKRYGVISPAAQGDFTAASDVEKNTFGWISDGTTNLMSDGSEGYRLI